jgi:hypothetical protein
VFYLEHNAKSREMNHRKGRRQGKQAIRRGKYDEDEETIKDEA